MLEPARASRRFPGLLDQGECGLNSLASDKVVLPALKLVVIDEEVFEFQKGFAGKVLEAANVSVHMTGLSNCDEPVIANLPFAILLLALNDTDEAGAHGAAGKGGFIHQEKNVDGVSISCAGLRKKTKVVWERHSRRQNFLENEDVLFGIEGEFVSEALRSFHNDLKDSVLFFKGPKLGGIC
jgi:hypothetical protein